MSIGPDAPTTTAAELRRLYESSNIGLLDVMRYTMLDDEPYPRTLRWYARLLRDCVLTDVLRRCHFEGCWERKTYTNILGIGMCDRHFSEWYS